MPVRIGAIAARLGGQLQDADRAVGAGDAERAVRSNWMSAAAASNTWAANALPRSITTSEASLIAMPSRGQRARAAGAAART